MNLLRTVTQLKTMFVYSAEAEAFRMPAEASTEADHSRHVIMTIRTLTYKTILSRH